MSFTNKVLRAALSKLRCQRLISAARSTSSTTLLRVSRLSTWASELSRKEWRIGTRVSDPTLFKAASSRRKPRSAACICANTFRRTSASRISVGVQTLAPAFKRPRYSRLPSGSAIASIWLTSAFASSALTSCPCRVTFGSAFPPGTPLDDVLFASWPGLKPSRQPWGVAQPNSRGMFLGLFLSSRSTHAPVKWYR